MKYDFQGLDTPLIPTDWERLDHRADELCGCCRLNLNQWSFILQELCYTELVCLLKTLQKQWKGPTPTGLQIPD